MNGCGSWRARWRQGGRELRLCIFCGQSGCSLEHAFPDWLLKNVQRGRPIAFHGALPERNIQLAGPNAAVRVRAVCKTCNNGWMSNLEKAAKPSLAAMLNDISIGLDHAEQTLVATWAMKTAMVFEC